MSHCRVCGDPAACYRPAQRSTLCESCAAETPAKIGRAEFDRRYWPAPESVPESTRREFFADYLASRCTFDAYLAATTEVCS